MQIYRNTFFFNNNQARPFDSSIILDIFDLPHKQALIPAGCLAATVFSSLYHISIFFVILMRAFWQTYVARGTHCAHNVVPTVWILYSTNQKNSTPKKVHKCKRTLCPILTRTCCRYCFPKNNFIGWKKPFWHYRWIADNKIGCTHFISRS